MFDLLLLLDVFCLGFWRGGGWCRRQQPRAQKRPGPVVAVRRSARVLPRLTRLGVFEDSGEMVGEEESATTKSEDEYSPGDYFMCYFCFVLSSIDPCCKYL